ncbi:MAG: methyltransferase [Alphaproteobacteria bacterium]
MTDIPTTLDGILNHRVTLEQPASGYRIAVDTILLAAAVPALAGDRILDMGCGVGGAMLSLACRVAGVIGLGLEIQSDLAALCRRNIERNIFASGLDVRHSDVTQLPPDLHGLFDHALINPPYHEEATHDVSRDAIKRTANTEKTGDLGLWINSAAFALKPSGTLTMIHRADRQEEILTHLQPAFGAITLLPLLPKKGEDPKRLILRARKDALYSVTQSHPLTLHKAEGGYTDSAEAALRHAQALVFQSP